MKQNTKSQLDKMQREERTKNIIRFVGVSCALLVLVSALMLYRFYPGKTTKVSGVVTGLNGNPVPKQGEILYLIVELDNGKIVEVRKPNFVQYQKNKRVQLTETKSSMLGNVRYTFMKYGKD